MKFYMTIMLSLSLSLVLYETLELSGLVTTG